MDEILGVIIDPEGMSFNDLKPIYKEFLLKLSVTLTKDELYQRSKMIMRRHLKKKQMRRNATSPTNHHHVLVSSNKFKRRLKHIFQKNLKFHKLIKNKKLGKTQGPPVKTVESSISTSSYDTRHFTPKEEPRNYRKKTDNQKKKQDRTSTSEESDFFSMRRNKNNNQNRNSSSGYVSCSECSYDSDTCTCTSADKCYCSLGNNNKKTTCCDCQPDVRFCGCDTDSCNESNKCYCNSNRRRNSILDQLKQRGFIPMENHRPVCKRTSNSKSTTSLEYMHNPIEAYYEKLKTRSVVVEKKHRSDQDYEFHRNLRNRALYAVGQQQQNHRHGRPASMRSYSSVKYGAKGG